VQLQAKYDALKESHEKLAEALEDIAEELDEDHLHNREDCTGDCPMCRIEQALKEAEKIK
jgi:hypothetical protein